jgi:2-phospho-L-lactate guanylyltransferase
MISKEDVYAMLELVKDPPVVIVVPDRKKEGTNALLVCPVGLIEYDYGPDSFERHCQRARQAGVRLEICELPSLALDMDVPEDLELVSNEMESWSA